MTADEMVAKRLSALEDENARLRAALEKHHQRAQEEGILGVFDEDNGEWVGIDFSDAYADSSLCELTVAALSASPAPSLDHTAGFRAGIEAAAKCVQDYQKSSWGSSHDGALPRRIRNLKPEADND